MFLAGARQNCDPELRSPSIRGALRYWYRALLGGRGTTDVDTLRKKETRVFGSTNCASPTRLRVVPYGVIEEHRRSNDEIDNLDNQNSGVGYLWYFVQADPNNRSYVAPGARFEVHLLARPGHEKALREAARAFWLLVHLGGLGTRSRRLAGGFAANLVEAPDALDLPAFEPVKHDADWLKTQLEGLGIGNKSLSGEPPFSVLHPDCADVWRLAGIETEEWTELVKTVGKRFKSTRGDLDVPDKVGLGLPMITPDGADPIKVKQKGTPVERRASPLWLQVIRRPNGALTPIVTLMRSQFASDGNEVKVSWDGGRETVTEPYRNIPPFVERDAAFDPISLL